MTGEPLAVVGIGLDGPAGLTPEARAHVTRAEILAGGRRHLDFFAEFTGERIVLEGDVRGWADALKNRDRQRRTVVLATGDPLFFGIGRLLLESLPKEELIFVPHVSSVALAFARLKETWNDACVVSVHGRPLSNLLPALRRREAKIALFTDASNDPAAIARFVCAHGLHAEYELCVCENLDGKDERITRWKPDELTMKDFAPLNVVVLLRRSFVHASDSTVPLPLLGIPESALRHRGEGRGLITKREVRVQALCYLELHHDDVFWDIGAGSGSVSLEAARLSPVLRVFAIERTPDELQENVDVFGLANVRMIAGEAPECLANLPDPDAVFIGGSGGRLIDILDCVTSRLKSGGRLVMTCIALETLASAWHWLGERRLNPQATSIQLAHSRPLGNLHGLAPENPIFLLRVTKP